MMRSRLALATLFAGGALVSPYLFAADSCDGRNVVVDPAGDATNPAPGGQGPTSQADIVSVSFDGSSSAAFMFTTITIANLTRIPSPGTGFTSYFVVWTSSNGTKYGTEVDVDGGTISYFWGPWNSTSNQLSAFNSVTGTFVPGVNGTITVPVPLSGIGNPPIPITNPSNAAAVTDPFAYTVAGAGAVGTGLVFNAFMDRAPNAGFGDRAFVCTAPPPPPPGDPCVLPGITLLTDPANDSTNPFGAGQNPNPSWDLRSLSISEPYANAPAKLVFTLKVESLAALPENTRWPIQFKVQGDPANRGRWIDMRTDPTQPSGVAFKYGTFVVTPASGTTNEAYGAPTPPLTGTGATIDGDADAASTFNADGTIRIVISRNKLGLANSSADLGKKLTGFLVRVRVTAVAADSTPDNMPNSLITTYGSYTIVGNNPFCRPNTAPIVDTLTATPGSGTSPLLVTLAGTAHDNDTQGPDPADTIASYTFGFGDGAPPVTQPGASTTHTYTVPGCPQTFSASLSVTDSRNKSSATALFVPVTVAAPNHAPVATLAASPSSGDTLDTIMFDAGGSTDADTGCDAIASYRFDFGDGNSPPAGAQATAQHTYSTPGNYTASVVVTDQRGAPNTATAAITIVAPANRPPVAMLTASPTRAAAPMTVSFDASGSSDPDGARSGDAVLRYDYDFGDGATATVLAPATTTTHDYVQPGVYDVRLRVFDKNGLASASDALVQITALNSPPQPVLAANPQNVGKNVAVTLDASGSSDPNGDAIVEYVFNPGDGSPVMTSATSQFAYAYAHGGTYTASVRVRDARGDLSTTAATVSITVTNAVPLAALSAQPQSGTGPLQVGFDASGSSDPDVGDGVASYTFDFGDGSAPLTRVGAATVQHLYSTANPYTASVTVRDGDGAASAPATILITVASGNRAPVARLTADRLAGDTPLAVRFDASGSADTDGDAVTQYTFSFGDGAAPVTQASPVVSHTYAAVGRYSVFATVRDARGAQSSNSDVLSIEVGSPAAVNDTGNASQHKGLLGGALSPAGLLVLMLAAARRRRAAASPGSR